MQAAAQAAKEKMSEPVFSLAASAAAAAITKSAGTNPIPQPDIQAQTRIRVFNLAGTARIGTSSWLSSTSQWASTYSCDPTALASLVQRYYADNFGRFMSPDPGYAGAMTNPQSLNRYGYVINDPVNGDDPSGLCAVFGAGVSVGSNPSANFDYLANLVGAVTAFPYSGLNYLGGVASIIQQGTSGANSSTQVELAALQNALSQNSGSIDVVAYSGDAEAFTEAYGLLTPQQQARIGSILYLSPAVAGQMVVIPGHTTIVEGAGPKDFFAGVATILPPNVPIISTNCLHSDFACLLTSAWNQFYTIAGDGSCNDPGSFSLLPNGVGGGGVVNTNSPFGGSGGGNNSSLSWYWQWMMLEPTPSVTSTITYKPIE
jgi:RHS repeat-associated protein